MALKTLQPDALTRFSLEDVFDGGDAGKLAWVSGWRKLPHIKREVAKLFEYPQQFAEDIFARMELRCADAFPRMRRTLRFQPAVCSSCPETGARWIRSCRRFADLPVHYIQSSDVQIVAAHKADAQDQTHLVHSRLEGEFVLSYQTSGGWVGITKDILTEVLGAGHDAKIAGLPAVAAGVLRLMCPNLVGFPDS